MRNITNRSDHFEDRFYGSDDKVCNLENKVDTKTILKDYDQDIQEIWDNIKRSNLRINEVNEGSKM